jgi:hypothetical protein
MAMEILSIDLAIAHSAVSGREVRLKPDGAILPPLAAYLKKRREIREARAARRLLTEEEGTDTAGESASLAVQLTRELPGRLTAKAVVLNEFRIGLELTGAVYPGGLKLMSILFSGGEIRVDEDRSPENPNLVIKTSASVWARVLSGKQPIETAYLQGRLKFIGPMETALTLKKLLSL